MLAQGTLTVVGESETMVRASMDAECNVSMDAHAPLGMPGLAGKLTVHQGKNDLIQGTALYYGEQGCGKDSAILYFGAKGAPYKINSFAGWVPKNFMLS